MTNVENFERENEVMLYAVQALLGLISTDVIAVGVRVEEERVEFVFWAHRHSSELDEDAGDAVFELDALFSDEHPLIEYTIHVGKPSPETRGSNCRMIYWAKG